MSRADFEQTWVPRIGERAAAQLHRGGNSVLAVPVMFIVAGIAYGQLDGATSSFDVVFWFASLAVGVIAMIYWIWGQIAFARSLSEWFGVRVHWFQLPRMRAARFDAWCGRHGLEARAQSGPAAPGSGADPATALD